MVSWYDNVVQQYEREWQLHEQLLREKRELKLLIKVERAFQRAGQQVARFDEYQSGAYHRTRLTFIDGRHVNVWWDGNNWKWGDHTWEVYSR